LDQADPTSYTNPNFKLTKKGKKTQDTISNFFMALLPSDMTLRECSGQTKV